MKVIIAGGGPTGLLLALRLAQANIKVDVFEAAEVPDENLRAALHGVPSIQQFRKAGILEEVRQQGIICKGFTYRKLDGTVLVSGDGDKLPADFDDTLTVLPIKQLGAILREHVSRSKLIHLKYGHKILGVGQSETTVWADVETISEGQKRFEADYLVGCDGGKSVVRTSLFGRHVFPGRPWHVQIVTTNTYYDFESHGWGGFNMVIDPDNWFMAGKLPDDVWRITYGESAELSAEECKRRQPERFKQMLPGNPDPDQYQVTHIAPYKIHQRCAPKMRVGRVILVGDAAHVQNPFSGLGLTCGMADVAGVVDCLTGISKGVADESILDKYDEVRRKIYWDVSDPVSSSALRRMWTDDWENLANDPFMKQVQKSAETAEGAVAVQRVSNPPYPSSTIVLTPPPVT